MHSFAPGTSLPVFASRPNKLHYVNKLAMTEDMKLASVALLGSVETLV